jgi:hypothetical protein
MPPENTDPVAKTQPAELDFDTAPTENPRIKKRSLKARATTPPTQAAASPEGSRASLTPDQPRPTTGYSPATSTASPGHTGYVRPGTSPNAEKPQAPTPSGVLYYSNGPKDAAAKMNSSAPTASRPATAPTQPAFQRPATTPMPTTSTSRPASTPQQAPNPNRPTGAATGNGPSGHSTQQTPTSRPASSTPSGAHAGTSAAASASTSRAVSTTVAGPASSSRPGGVSDYRANIERQSREQKSIGGILNLVVYGLIAIFICGAGLAAYGAHVIFKQLHAQSMTVSDLDTRYAAANEQLNAQLKATAQTVLEMQAQVNRDETLALKQQDAIVKLQSSLTAETDALRQERIARATETSIRISETAALRTRLREIEAHEQPSYRQ